MPDSSLILSLPYILPAQAQKHVTHNEALERLDLLVQTVAHSRDQATPPAGPVDGDTHIVPPSATGDWAGHDGKLATWDTSAWRFADPQDGWRAYVLADGIGVVWDGTAWVPDRPDLDDLAGVGINAAADATNRLSVAAPATLLSHEGAGHQLKLNKAGVSDTASLLYQTNWSGRAEMGCAGSDDFAIKVSADGATWTTALQFAAATGIASGQAVQQSATDTTAGRLARADHAYSPGNLLGNVSQSGGTPTGAVIERGSNANGEYVRFADGTQICCLSPATALAAATPIGVVFSTGSDSSWTYPAAFASANVAVSASADSSARWAVARPASATAALYRQYSATSSAANVNTRLLAVGRWF